MSRALRGIQWGHRTPDTGRCAGSIYGPQPSLVRTFLQAGVAGWPDI